MKTNRESERKNRQAEQRCRNPTGRIQTGQRIGKNLKGEIQLRPGQHAAIAEKFRAERDELGKMDGQVKAEPDPKKSKMVGPHLLHG
jgi:hypothetical protein